MENNAIIVKNVSKSFNMNKPKGLSEILSHLNSKQNNKIRALQDVSLSVKQGEMLGIIGLNGSGKTTLLRTISGIYKPDSGYVKVNGILAPLLQIGTGFQNEYIAKENIMMYGLLMELTKSQIEKKTEKILEFAELTKFSNLRLKHYSAGMKTRLAFATALQINPDILLVDEILSVGDAAFREKSLNAFLSFKKQNKTILYTTHNLSKLSKLCDRVLLLDSGKVIMTGEPEQVVKKYTEIINQHNKT